MKRKILFIAMVLMLTVAGVALPGIAEWTKQSSTNTASAVITASPGVFDGIYITTDGTNAVTLDIYDNATAASGTTLIPQTVITSSATDRVQAISFDPPVRFYNGVYVNISIAGGGSASYKAYWRNENM